MALITRSWRPPGGRRGGSSPRWPSSSSLHLDGVGLLLKGPWGNIVWTTVTAMVGLAALGAGLTGWLLRRATWPEQVLLVAAGLGLVYPGWFQDLIGFALFALALGLQGLGRRGPLPARSA